jgi:hypothetical protein
MNEYSLILLAFKISHNLFRNNVELRLVSDVHNYSTRLGSFWDPRSAVRSDVARCRKCGSAGTPRGEAKRRQNRCKICSLQTMLHAILPMSAKVSFLLVNFIVFIIEVHKLLNSWSHLVSNRKKRLVIRKTKEESYL